MVKGESINSFRMDGHNMDLCDYWEKWKCFLSQLTRMDRNRNVGRGSAQLTVKSLKTKFREPLRRAMRAALG